MKIDLCPARPPTDLALSVRWIADECPACPAGPRLLRQLSEENPRLQVIAEHYGFCDPTDAELKAHPRWLAFLEYYERCDNGNEV